jgi:hypothetical protein
VELVGRLSSHVVKHRSHDRQQQQIPTHIWASLTHTVYRLGPIASAVVLPEQDVESPPRPASSPTSLKRRQSSTYEHDAAKRPRLDGDDQNSDRRSSIKDEITPAVPVPKGRERGRERRLFGAALGALSQNSASAAQRRRSEIEKRQQAQRKQEDDESEQRKLERRAKRRAQRWKEHEQFEKDSVCAPSLCPT